MHVKLLFLGVIMVGIVIFAFMFGGDLWFNQQEIANTPMEVPVTSKDIPISNNLDDSQQADTSAEDKAANEELQAQSAANMSQSDDFDAMEKDLNETNLEVDSNNAELESEASGL